MDNTEIFAIEDEEETTSDDSSSSGEKPTGKRHFNDTLLTQLLCPVPATLPRGVARRVYGCMSDTPVSRRTRLYQKQS